MVVIRARDPVGAERGANPRDPLDGPLPAVVAGPRAIAVVKIRRAVQRGREVDIVVAAEIEDLVAEQCKVRGDDEETRFADVRYSSVPLRDDHSHEIEVQEAARPPETRS